MYQTMVRFANWRKDDAGLLRVTARVLKEGVFPYSQADSAGVPELAHLPEVREYIPVAEFTSDALTTLEGKDVTIPVPGKEHEWRTADVAREDGLSVGSVAGRPFVTDDGAIQCDFLISDADTIRAIEARDLIEVSAGYTGTLTPEAGTWNGIPYDAVQKNLRFNHILLLPVGGGRCGADVKIINQKKDTPMAKPISVEKRFGNSTKTYRFTNEEDQAEAERMNEDARAFSAEEVQNAMTRVNELTEEIKAKNQELDANKATLTNVQEELARVLSPEAQVALAEELIDQSGAEEAIIEEEIVNTAEAAEIKNQIKNCRSIADRRAVVVRAVMIKNSIDTSKWDTGQVNGAFSAMRARASQGKASHVPMGGTLIKNSAANPTSRLFNSIYGVKK